MIDFRNRSYKEELLDGNNIPFQDIEKNMQELNIINTLLGGHNITLRGFKELVQHHKEITACEIGCGGGDNLVAIKRWCSKKAITLHLIGIDINQECIKFAEKNNEHLKIKFIVADYKKVKFDESPDIIFSSLFCHHFSNEQLIEMATWMKDNSTKGFFINDLHRHPIAYYFIKFTTSIFSTSYLVKNDAPLSVLRGFKKNEIIHLLLKAGLKQFQVSWCWAFRYLIIYSHGC